jgi:hypothetical protein
MHSRSRQNSGATHTPWKTTLEDVLNASRSIQKKVSGYRRFQTVGITFVEGDHKHGRRTTPVKLGLGRNFDTEHLRMKLRKTVSVIILVKAASP